MGRPWFSRRPHGTMLKRGDSAHKAMDLGLHLFLRASVIPILVGKLGEEVVPAYALPWEIDGDRIGILVPRSSKVVE